MTDRELLELAAKAAGIEHKGYCGTPPGLILWETDYGLKLWNPLTDDGDALRLAVKLEIDLQHNWQSVIGIYTRNDSVKVGIPSHAEVGGDEYQDRLAATRIG